jgi:hypothetical protein
LLDKCNLYCRYTTAWAMAKVGHLDAALFRAMAKVAQGSLGEFNAQDLANIAWWGLYPVDP